MPLPPESKRPLRPIAAIADAGLFAEVSVGVRAAAYCAVCFFGGLLFVTRGGLIWLDLVDGYGLSLALFTVGVLECWDWVAVRRATCRLGRARDGRC